MARCWRRWRRSWRAAPLSRASIALRVVPGEYDLRWVGLITQVVRQQPTATAKRTAQELQERLGQPVVVVNRPGELGIEREGGWEWRAAPDLTEAWLSTLAKAAAAFTAQDVTPETPIIVRLGACCDDLGKGCIRRDCKPPLPDRFRQ